MKEESQESYIVRIRGLPWSATDTEIINFLDNVNIVGGEQGIHRTFTREGRPSGEAYIEVCSEEDVENGLGKDHQTMGRRYIEVFKSSQKEMEYVLNRSGADRIEHDGGDGVVRLRGLPFQCSKEEIAQFFSGLEIIPNGITIPTNSVGRSSGEAFVQFSNQGYADKALNKHKHKIGHRYIEIFKSTKMEIRESLGESPRMGRNMNPRRGPYDRPMRGGRNDTRGGGYMMRGGNRRGRMMGGGYRGGGGGGGYGNYGCGDYYDDYDGYSDGNMRGGYGPRGRGGMKGYGRNNRGENRMYDGDNYDSGYGSQHVVHMRGLPFRASEQDISEFYSPIIPIQIHMEYGKDGRLNGEADAIFASYQDAQAAMKKDRETMQHRYIELFLRSGGDGNDDMGDYSGRGMGCGPGMGYDDSEPYGSGEMGMRGGNYKQF